MFRQQRMQVFHARSWAIAGLTIAVLATAAGCITIEAVASPPPETPSPPPVETPVPATDTPAPPSTPEPPSPTEEPSIAVPETPTPIVETPLPTPADTGLSIDPLSEEALVASMLDPADDVDPTAETSGVDVGTEADDLPAFAEQGGLRRAAQTIHVGFDYTVFDFRYQFPDADSAAAFLEAEADGLGETHLGGVEGVPPAQLGDETRYYTSHTEIFVIQDSFNYLIRVENVVAKVWIGGDPEFINAEDALDIATSAWGRMTILFDPSEVEGI